MTAELHCNAAQDGNRCTAAFIIPDLFSVAEARRQASTQGWRTRKPSSERMPVLDRCPEHATPRKVRPW